MFNTRTAAAAFGAGLLFSALAQPVSAAEPSICQPGEPGVEDIRPCAAPIVIKRGGGTLLNLTGNAASVFVADPDIADVRVASPTSIFVTAKKGGETAVYASNHEGEVLLKREVKVPRRMVVMRGDKIDTGEAGPPAINLVIPLTPPGQPAAPAP